MTLANSLSKIEWKHSADSFCADIKVVETVERGCKLVAIWNHELSFQHHQSPALSFLQEMKASLLFVPACFAVGLYKPAASSMRAAVENALYFSYFCDHYIELKTLMRDKSYFLSKKKIIEYHELHTPLFKEKQAALGLASELDAWYGEISAIIHGQIPGVWSSQSLEYTGHNSSTLKAAAREFSRAVLIINFVFLLTTAEDVWEGMSSTARRYILAGMSASRKSLLRRSVV